MASGYTEFERRVADLYRALGADVRHDADMAGSQIDVVVVERTASGLEVISAIECKDYTGTVGVNQVAEFAEKVSALRGLNKVHAGLIVTEGGFSRPARIRADEARIGLLEVSDLETRVALDLSIASSAVTEAIDRARKLQRLLGDALASNDQLTTYDWEDVHGEIAKLVDLIRDGRELQRRTRASSHLERRVGAAVARVEEDSARTMDAVWYLRAVLRLSEETEQTLPIAGAETDRTSAALVRLREVDQARAQIRARLRRLEETCSRLGIGD